jgi:hypothetical protein
MSTWTKDKPTVRGWYWVSVAPDWRSGAYSFSPVTRCHVWPDEDNANIETTAGYVYFKLSAPCLIGAQWMPAKDPADPFAEQPRDNSRDRDLL